MRQGPSARAPWSLLPPRVHNSPCRCRARVARAIPRAKLAPNALIFRYFPGTVGSAPGASTSKRIRLWRCVADLPQVEDESKCRAFVVARNGSLTYMSIRNEWQTLVAQGDHLFRLKPLDGDRAERTVLLSKEMNDLIEGPWEEGAEGNRLARLLATLHNVVAGRRLVVCLTPGTESKHRASRPNHGFNLGHPLSGQAGVASVLCLCRKRRVIRGNLQTKIGKGSLVGMVSAGRSKLKRVETRDNGDKTRMGEVLSNV